MALLYQDDRFLEHETGNHPERALRLSTTHEHLASQRLVEKCQTPVWSPATAQQIGCVHDQEYIKFVEKFAADGGGRIEADTIVSQRSYEVACLATGAVCDAVRRVTEADQLTALCLLRPPGHHALPRSAMGFCLFNHIAIGARFAIDQRQLDRVLVVDWDVHHGNGTQDVFWEDEQVGFFSAHRFPFYPGTGDADETGAGKGLGATRNLPVTFGTPADQYLTRFGDELGDFAARVKPQLVMLSAGFDAHRLDPIGSLGLEVEDFAALTERVLQIADAYCQGRIVSVLEGGYHPEMLSHCVATHLEHLI